MRGQKIASHRGFFFLSNKRPFRGPLDHPRIGRRWLCPTYSRVSSMSCIGFLARHDFHCRGAGACADHRAKVRAVMVLRPVGVVDAAVDRSVHRLEGDLLRQAGGDYPPGRLPHRGLVPTRILPVVAAHVEDIIDRRRNKIKYVSTACLAGIRPSLRQSV